MTDQSQVSPGLGGWVEVGVVEWSAGAMYEVLPVPAQCLALLGGMGQPWQMALSNSIVSRPAVGVVIADPSPAGVPVEWASQAR